MGFVFQICASSACCNRRIQANKVPLAPYGDSQQTHANNGRGCLFSVPLIRSTRRMQRTQKEGRGEAPGAPRNSQPEPLV